ncbi:ABC transporter G family member 20 [Hibiscus syriacus]|uniref:ABC transporter G family member 20 n=1 Tax=Hibiscus syriacus TaxID=106335 RepID=A0A6A2WA15_HIBSY|nr:ABC transporter G family member 20 [Hibiscus syriacus]
MEFQEFPMEVVEEKNDVHRILDIQIPTIDPFIFSFRNLTYEVKVGSSKSRFPCCGKKTNVKSLLNDISGGAKEGEVMAILGPSGSGKSTLIDALANRIDKHSLKGSITLNQGFKKGPRPRFRPRYSGFAAVRVTRDGRNSARDGCNHVEETLMFSSEFRLPRSVSKEKNKVRVQALIDQLGLRNAANTVIGDEGHRGISGGERRRVSIGIDIIHDPILLFLDKPTSGLDSTSAYKVVKDSSGSPINLHRFFDDFGHPIPGNANPCEYALDLVSELEETPSRTPDFSLIQQVMEGLRSSFVAAIAGLLPDFFLAFVMSIAIVCYFLFLCGFLVARDRLPRYWLWFHYISLMKYPYEGLLRNEFVPLKCFGKGAAILDRMEVEKLPTPLKDELLSSMGC